MRSTSVRRDEDVSLYVDGTFLYNKELNKGFIKRNLDTLSLPDTKFETVVDSLEQTKPNVLDTVKDKDLIYFHKGLIFISKELTKYVGKTIDENNLVDVKVFHKQYSAAPEYTGKMQDHRRYFTYNGEFFNDRIFADGDLNKQFSNNFFGGFGEFSYLELKSLSNTIFVDGIFSIYNGNIGILNMDLTKYDLSLAPYIKVKIADKEIIFDGISKAADGTVKFEEIHYNGNKYTLSEFLGNEILDSTMENGVITFKPSVEYIKSKGATISGVDPILSGTKVEFYNINKLEIMPTPIMEAETVEDEIAIGEIIVNGNKIDLWSTTITNFTYAGFAIQESEPTEVIKLPEATITNFTYAGFAIQESEPTEVIKLPEFTALNK